MNNTRTTLSRIFIGLIVVAIGIGYLGNALWNWDFKIFFDGWWTLFLIIPAIYSLIKWKINLFSILLLVTGVALLLNAQGLLTAGFWSVFLPVLVIVLGLYIIFGRLVNRKVKNFDSMVRNRQIGGDTSSCPEYTAIFGESRVDQVADQLGLKVLAKLPIDPALAAACDAGKVEELETNYLTQVAAQLDQ